MHHLKGHFGDATGVKCYFYGTKSQEKSCQHHYSQRTAPLGGTARSTPPTPAFPHADVEGLRRLIGADLGSRRAAVCLDRFRRGRNRLNTTNLIRGK